MIPRLIHPVDVVLAQVNAGGTTVDAVYEQPAGPVATTPVTVRAQVKTAKGQSLRMTPGGASAVPQTEGHLVCEIDALDAAGVTLHVGDRITSVAGRAVNHRVTRLEDHAVYSGRAYHRWAFFTPEGDP